MKIVLGGSRHLEYIPSEVADKLENWMQSRDLFLVGDASGSDTAFQGYLAKKKYENVLILSSAEYVRNNVGKWPTQIVESGLKSKSSSAHAFKDRKMTQDADTGLMIWDCASAGTLSNAIDLLRQGKECFIWIAPDSELCRFDNLASMDRWLEKYPEVKMEAESRLAKFAKREAQRKTADIQETLFG